MSKAKCISKTRDTVSMTSDSLESNTTTKNYDMRLNPHAPEFVPRSLSIDRSLARKVLNEGDEDASYGAIYDSIWQERANPCNRLKQLSPYYNVRAASTTSLMISPTSAVIRHQRRMCASLSSLTNCTLNANAPEYVPQFLREQSLKVIEDIPKGSKNKLDDDDDGCCICCCAIL